MLQAFTSQKSAAIVNFNPCPLPPPLFFKKKKIINFIKRQKKAVLISSLILLPHQDNWGLTIDEIMF